MILIAALGALGFSLGHLLLRQSQIPDSALSTGRLAFGPWLALAGWIMIIVTGTAA